LNRQGAKDAKGFLVFLIGIPEKYALLLIRMNFTGQADDSKKASTLRAKLKLNPNSAISLPTENIEFLYF